MYDQPILGGYEQALQLSGSPRAPVYTFSGTTAGAPAFPAGVSSGSVAQQSPWAVNPDFAVGHTWQSNAQVERGLGHDFTASVAVMYARGYQLPVVNDINLTNPTGVLADGRPIYNTTASAATRVDPRFNHIFEVQSIGESDFKSVTFQADKRFSHGLSFNVQYSFGKGTDDTPLRTQLTVQSEAGPSDPSNLKRDEGPNPLDMRHSLNGNVVYQTSSQSSNAFVRGLLSHNQIGVLLQFNSGLPANILASTDLNKDATSSDRPLGVTRNSLYLPARKNVDMRYTRAVPIRGTVRAEVIAELKNVFNTVPAREHQHDGDRSPWTRPATRWRRFRPIPTPSSTRRASSSASSSSDSRCVSNAVGAKSAKGAKGANGAGANGANGANGARRTLGTSTLGTSTLGTSTLGTSIDRFNLVTSTVGTSTVGTLGTLGTSTSSTLSAFSTT